jgi:hypothetical protein
MERMKQFVWNVEHNKKVNILNIKQFNIVPARDPEQKKWVVLAYIAGSVVIVHQAETKEECVSFIDEVTE